MSPFAKPAPWSSPTDIRIAASALEHGLTRVTRDPHYVRVEGLSVEMLLD